MKCVKCGNANPYEMIYVWDSKLNRYGVYCAHCKDKAGKPSYVKWMQKAEGDKLVMLQKNTYLSWLQHEGSSAKVAAFIYDIVAKYGTKDREASITVIRKKLSESVHNKTSVPAAPATPAIQTTPAAAKAPVMKKEEERVNSCYERKEIEEYNNHSGFIPPWEDGCKEEVLV